MAILKTALLLIPLMGSVELYISPFILPISFFRLKKEKKKMEITLLWEPLSNKKEKKCPWQAIGGTRTTQSAHAVSSVFSMKRTHALFTLKRRGFAHIFASAAAEQDRRQLQAWLFPNLWKRHPGNLCQEPCFVPAGNKERFRTSGLLWWLSSGSRKK